jgi:hypothetical protein
MPRTAQSGGQTASNRVSPYWSPRGLAILGTPGVHHPCRYGSRPNGSWWQLRYLWAYLESRYGLLLR